MNILKNVDIIAEPNITRKLLKYHFLLPWPLDDRFGFVEFNAVPLPNKSSLIITMKSPESENYLGIKVPALNEGELRMRTKIGCSYLEMIDSNTTKVTLLSCLDFQIVQNI
jgi:hypothetical protein